MINKNEKGITLVIVLITITVFSILGLSMFAVLLNNMTQAETTERDIQTLDMAEMGVQEYRMVFQDYYERVMPSIRKNIQETIVADYEKDQLREMEEYEELAVQQFVQRFHSSNLSESYEKTIEPNDPRLYRVNNQDISCRTCGSAEPGETAEVSFRSEGQAGDETRRITSTMTLSFGEINLDTGEGDPGGGPGSGTDDYSDIIQKPDNVEQECTEPGMNEDFNGANCTFSGSYSPNHPHSIEDSDIVIEGAFTSNKSMNQGIQNSTVYVEGSTTIYQPINGIHESQWYVGGAAVFRNINNGINDSTIVVGGDADFNEPLPNLTNSMIYVQGDANFNDKPMNNTSDDDSAICVAGNVDGLVDNLEYNVYSPSLDNDQFEQYCLVEGNNGGIEEGDTNFEWDFNAGGVDYDYED